MKPPALKSLLDLVERPELAATLAAIDRPVSHGRVTPIRSARRARAVSPSSVEKTA
jgi:hypothetical protein